MPIDFDFTKKKTSEKILAITIDVLAHLVRWGTVKRFANQESISRPSGSLVIGDFLGSVKRSKHLFKGH